MELYRLWRCSRRGHKSLVVVSPLTAVVLVCVMSTMLSLLLLSVGCCVVHSSSISKTRYVVVDDVQRNGDRWNRIEDAVFERSVEEEDEALRGRFDTQGKSQTGATKKRPQAIIIGVKKGGTRALLEFIRIHPDVRAPGPETHFFDKNYERGLEWYRQQMPPTIDGQITIEKTPSYFVTKGVPQRVYNMSKDVLLIVVVRDPVTRAVSDYTQALAKRTDVKSFEEMAFLDNSTRLVDTSWGAIRIGVYAKHLERWLQYFPLHQMHFVSGEKLISDPAGEMAKVQDFLGLKRVISDKHFYYNATKGFPCLKKPEGSGNPHCLGKTKGRSHPDIDESVLQRLRDFFRPFNHKFYQMSGINFGWS